MYRCILHTITQTRDLMVTRTRATQSKHTLARTYADETSACKVIDEHHHLAQNLLNRLCMFRFALVGVRRAGPLEPAHEKQAHAASTPARTPARHNSLKHT